MFATRGAIRGRPQPLCVQATFARFSINIVATVKQATPAVFTFAAFPVLQRLILGVGSGSKPGLLI